jgi:hypothetical protein
MSSFINLMANDIWPDADITRRTEAMVRTEFSLEAETILNRKVAGISLGQYTPTDADLAEMARFKVVVDAAQAAGVAARADMALLLDTMAYETAMKRLAQPLPPEDATDEEKAQDAAERAEAQAVVDGASQAVVDLYSLRNPPAPPAPEPTPELELEPIVEAE